MSPRGSSSTPMAAPALPLPMPSFRRRLTWRRPVAGLAISILVLVVQRSTIFIELWPRREQVGPSSLGLSGHRLLDARRLEVPWRGRLHPRLLPRVHVEVPVPELHQDAPRLVGAD